METAAEKIPTPSLLTPGVNYTLPEKFNNYYPFGGTLAGTSYQRLGALTNKYRYQGKEWQEDLDLNWYDFHARMYDPWIGKTTTMDPHAESYYDWSVYSWSGNNPINMIDPTGMDWYEDEHGNVKWVEGSDDIEGYNNIGTVYTADYGNGTSVTYEQNEIQSITETVLTEDQWETQIVRDENGEIISYGNCYNACGQMLQNAGVETAGRDNEIITGVEVNQGRNHSVEPTDQAEGGINVINRTIDNNQPLIVGVDYQQGSPNPDGTTDHFVLVGARTTNLTNNQVSYRFFDPRTSYQQYGASPNNTFTITNRLLGGTYTQGGTNLNYKVTTVRPNR